MAKKGGGGGGNAGRGSDKGHREGSFPNAPPSSNLPPREGSGQGLQIGPAPTPEPFAFPEFQLPDYSQFFAQQRADQEAAQRRAERARGESQVSDLWARRLDAASEATSLVDRAISQERSHAYTTGQDYSVGDDQRLSRINNQFADLWSEGSESQLAQLATQYGNPEQDQATRNRIYNGGAYEWEYDVIRGESGIESGNETGGEQVGGPVSDGNAARILLTDDEEEEQYLLSR